MYYSYVDITKALLYEAKDNYHTNYRLLIILTAVWLLYGFVDLL